MLELKILVITVLIVTGLGYVIVTGGVRVKRKVRKPFELLHKEH